jgi:hypothetical protein
MTKVGQSLQGDSAWIEVLLWRKARTPSAVSVELGSAHD